MKLKDTATLIRNFCNETSDPYEWGDFITEEPNDPLDYKIRYYCNSVSGMYPPPSGAGYCNEEGGAKLLTLADLLEGGEEKTLDIWLNEELSKNQKP